MGQGLHTKMVQVPEPDHHVDLIHLAQIVDLFSIELSKHDSTWWPLEELQLEAHGAVTAVVAADWPALKGKGPRMRPWGTPCPHTPVLWFQVASRVLGIPCSKIHISETSTNTVPNTSPTAASASSDLNGAAVQNACEVLVGRLEPYKTRNPKGSWEDWVSGVLRICCWSLRP